MYYYVSFACSKNFLKLEKMRCFEHNFQKVSRPLMFLDKFNFCFQARYGEKCAGRFVKRKHFSNFHDTVPTIGFRVSMVENGERQIFIKL